jgi:hypothetical protein
MGKCIDGNHELRATPQACGQSAVSESQVTYEERGHARVEDLGCWHSHQTRSAIGFETLVAAYRVVAPTRIRFMRRS